ncbi:MAG: hypothetical protein ABI286_09905 [Edaphobacter sp.]
MQDRVNDHLLICTHPAEASRGKCMGQQNTLSPNSFIEVPQGMAPAPVTGASKATAADRLYQVAALAAGVFLLASLL